MPSGTLAQRVGRRIQEDGMIVPGDRVIAGVSGGADSVCLLLLLAELREREGFSLRAVHVHHGLRADADGDRDYVSMLCAKAGIPLTVEQVRAGEYARRRHMSTEEAGRVLRQQAFAREAKRWDEEAAEAGEKTVRPCRIALAHHLEDCAETVLFNLCRGSSLAGLRGILPVNGSTIRPLIGERREEIEAYLRAGNVTWRTDESNASPAYTRNRIRGDILPLLESEVNSGAAKHIAAAGAEAAAAEAFLETQTAAAAGRCLSADSICAGAGKTPARGRVWTVRLTALRMEPEILQRRVLYRVLAECAGKKKDLEAVHVEALLRLAGRRGNGSLSLPCGITAVKSYGELRLSRGDTAPSAAEDDLAATGLPVSGTAYEYSKFAYVPGLSAIPQNNYTKWFDYDRISASLSFRRRRKGDRITVTDEGASKTLARYMIDEKIPVSYRDRIVMPADGSEILWIPGHRINAHYKVTDKTKRVLQISLPDLRRKEMNEQIDVLIEEKDIEKRICSLGEQISRDYEGREVHLIGILKGASFFMCELAKRITVPVSIDFMSVSSYGSGTESSGVVRIKKDMDEPIEGMDVIVVEDIVDSGRTLSFLGDLLKKRGAASIRYCTLLDKPDRRVTDLKVDYTGFVIPDKFVVGYGMDYDQKYRNLPYIGVVKL